MENLLGLNAGAWTWDYALLLAILAGICLLLYWQWRIRYLNTHYPNYRVAQDSPKVPQSNLHSFEKFVGPTLFKRGFTKNYTNYFFEDKVYKKPINFFISHYYGNLRIVLDFEYADVREVVEKYHRGHKQMMSGFQKTIKTLCYTRMRDDKNWTATQAAAEIKALLEKNYGNILKNGTVYVNYIKILK